MEAHTNWQYVLRTSPQIYVQDGSISQPINAYPLAQGQIFHRPEVGFTQHATILLNLTG